MKDFSQVYVIGDIHGCKDLLERIHKKIVKKSKNAEGHKILIYLGDLLLNHNDLYPNFCNAK